MYLDLWGHTTREVSSKTTIEFMHTTCSAFPGKVLSDDWDIITRDIIEYYVTPLDEYSKLVESFVGDRETIETL